MPSLLSSTDALQGYGDTSEIGTNLTTSTQQAHTYSLLSLTAIIPYVSRVDGEMIVSFDPAIEPALRDARHQSVRSPVTTSRSSYARSSLSNAPLQVMSVIVGLPADATTPLASSVAANGRTDVT